jgi:hypothetical protein
MADILSPSEFKRKGDNRRRKPQPKPKFSSSGADSKTMRVSGGKLPTPPSIHPHRQHAGVRSHRAK